MKEVDLLIIGGGPAGLSAAIKAREEGVRDILILERNSDLGGILGQCIHNGFGLHYFKEELTGPEYAKRLVDKVKEYGIRCETDTMVIDANGNRVITALSKKGLIQYKAGAVILAMGCRERPRGGVGIPGARCAGIYTAGAAQEYVNLKGYMPGTKVVILGSGDIGLIMARRMTLEGAEVKCVAELLPYSGGLKRNIAQCLDDYDIPLLLSHTVTRIIGKDRVEAVVIAQVDENLSPIPGTEVTYECDTLLLSVGLIPENELSRKMGVVLSKITSGAVVDSSYQTNVKGVFSCGNVLHVHDLVDMVTMEAFEAAESAAHYLKSSHIDVGKSIPVCPERGVRYVIPQFINSGDHKEKLKIKFRSDKVYKDAKISLYYGDEKQRTVKKRIVSPGEMEELTIDGKSLDAGVEKITIKIEG